MMKSNSKDRAILYKKFETAMKDVFNECLTMLELFVQDEEQFNKLRSRFLRIGNNKCRFIKRQLKNYLVEYKPVHLEHVSVNVAEEGENES